MPDCLSAEPLGTITTCFAHQSSISSNLYFQTMQFIRIARQSQRTIRSFSAVATLTTPTYPPTVYNTNTRLSPSAYYASQNLATAAASSLDLEFNGASMLPKFSAVCDRCGFEPSTNCRTCDEVLMSSVPLNDEPWDDTDGNTSFSH